MLVFAAAVAVVVAVGSGGGARGEARAGKFDQNLAVT